MRKLVLVLVPVVAMLWAPAGRSAPKGKKDAAPSLRMIPGLTAKDAHPSACVDCHRNYPERKMDVRLSTMIRRFNKKVDPKILVKAQASSPGLKLSGRHPEIGELTSIPKMCMGCHGRGSKEAPPFARLLHAIHLTGGKANHFITLYQGECTHCHKLDVATGTWRIPSAAEKP